jgi:hypothetical protein
MRTLKILSLCGLLLFWGLPSQAAQPNGLYEAEVETLDQGRDARATAMAEAMAAVLVKVSGSSALLDEEAIQSAMADAARYAKQYRYRSEEIPLKERKVTEGGEAAPENRLLLWVGFDSTSIDNLLHRFGFTVWSAARPTTLVWLAVEEGSRRVLVGANDQGLVREVLDAEAQRHAIPLRLPLLDLTDQSKVRPVDIWGGFIDNIEAASQRYETQAVLIGKLYSAGKHWEARWTLRYQGLQHEWQQSAADVTAVIASGVGGTSDYLSQRFAERSYLGVEQLVLRIDGVKGMGDFRRISDYLLSLHGITAMTLRRVDATSSSFLVQIEGGREAVLQAIAMGDVLVKVETPEPEPLLSPEVNAPSQADAPVQPESPPGQQQDTPDAQPPAEGSGPSSDNAEPTDDSGRLPEPPPVIPIQELVYRLLS